MSTTGPRNDDATLRLLVEDLRGLTVPGDPGAGVRRVDVVLPARAAVELAAALLGLPPGAPAPVPGVHTVALPGGRRTVTLAEASP